MDYQKAESDAVSAIKAAIPKSLKKDMNPISEGLSAELFANDTVFPKHYMACAIDGVGTKLLLAEAMGKYDTVGQDLVAMSANDLATLGAVSPFLFIDYFAVGSEFQKRGLTGSLMKGIAKGLEMCDCADVLHSSININIGKGETASVDELMGGLSPGMGFDIAGGMIGFVEKDKVHTTVNQGDIIIALDASGPHSNGYTDLRLKLLDGSFESRPEFKEKYTGKYSLNDELGDGTIGEALLEPTKIYSKAVAAVAKEIRMVGVNNTGYGLKNLNRIKGHRFVIDKVPRIMPIFDLMQKESGYSNEQMYRTFNMGMGFFMIVPANDAHKAVELASKYEKAYIVGRVEEGEGVDLHLSGEKITYTGY